MYFYVEKRHGQLHGHVLGCIGRHGHVPRCVQMYYFSNEIHGQIHGHISDRVEICNFIHNGTQGANGRVPGHVYTSLHFRKLHESKYARVACKVVQIHLKSIFSPIFSPQSL